MREGNLYAARHKRGPGDPGKTGGPGREKGDDGSRPQKEKKKDAFRKRATSLPFRKWTTRKGKIQSRGGNLRLSPQKVFPFSICLGGEYREGKKKREGRPLAGDVRKKGKRSNLSRVEEKERGTLSP